MSDAIMGFILVAFFVLVVIIAVTDGPRVTEGKEDCVAQGGQALDIGERHYCILDGTSVEIR